jgi:hypothetical protein
MPSPSARFIVTAIAGDCQLAQQYDLQVTCGAAHLQPPGGSLPSATVGRPYSGQGITVADSPGQAYWLFTASTLLPSGMWLSTSGQLFGTPTASAEVTFNVTAYGPPGCTLTGTFLLSVAAPGPCAVTLLPPTYTALNAVVGQPYAGTSFAATVTPASSDSLVFTATGLPAGLVIQPQTGIISGMIVLCCIPCCTHSTALLHRFFLSSLGCVP